MQVKSETSKAKWLMEIATNKDFKVNFDIFNILLGTQKGNNTGRDFIFMHKKHIKVMNITNPFYKEALKAITIFNRKKGIPIPRAWDDENIFFNPLIMNKSFKTLRETEYFRQKGVFRLGQLLEEKAKEAQHKPFDTRLTAVANILTLDMDVEKEDIVILRNKTVEMSLISQKELYEEAIYRNCQDHSHQGKWGERLEPLIVWEEVWESVHHFLSSNVTKTAIWEQIHLNYYTQYSYNKWHNTSEECPLCKKLPESIYHIILHCDFVNNLWVSLTPVLMTLHRKGVDDVEKALGILHIKKTTGMLLRNWLTYKLREQVLQYERAVYHTKAASTEAFKVRYNQSVATEVKNFMYRYSAENKLHIFDNLLGHGNVLFQKIRDGEYRLNKIFS